MGFIISLFLVLFIIWVLIVTSPFYGDAAPFLIAIVIVGFIISIIYSTIAISVPVGAIGYAHETVYSPGTYYKFPWTVMKIVRKDDMHKFEGPGEPQHNYYTFTKDGVKTRVLPHGIYFYIDPIYYCKHFDANDQILDDYIAEEIKTKVNSIIARYTADELVGGSSEFHDRIWNEVNNWFWENHKFMWNCGPGTPGQYVMGQIYPPNEYFMRHDYGGQLSDYRKNEDTTDNIAIDYMERHLNDHSEDEITDMDQFVEIDQEYVDCMGKYDNFSYCSTVGTYRYIN